MIQATANSAIQSARRVRHRKHANPFTIRGEIAVPDWQQVFGRSAPFALDIGFGEGRFLLELAQKHPEWNVLGLEIRPHYVEQALAAAKQLGITNVHAMLANANEHLSALLPDKSVTFVAVNFPDPWYKKRHHKRRVVKPDWLAALRPKLQQQAEIHAMSDYAPVAEMMQSVFNDAPDFRRPDGVEGFESASTTGIMTEREIKHLGRGEPVYRMRYCFTGTNNLCLVDAG